MPDNVLGLEGRFYLNSGTLSASATNLSGLTLTHVATVKNLTLGMTKGEADVTTRANSGWEQMRGTLKRAEIGLEMVFKPGDTQQEALRSAFMNNTQVGGAVLSGEDDAVGSEGLVSNFEVLSWERTEQIEDAMMINCTIKPHSHTSYVEVTA